MNRDELDALAHRIAYSCARSDIECFAKEEPRPEGADPRVHWYDLSKPISDEFERTALADAVLYLESRALLQRQPAKPYLVTIMDVQAESLPIPQLEKAG